MYIVLTKTHFEIRNPRSEASLCHSSSSLPPILFAMDGPPWPILIDSEPVSMGVQNLDDIMEVPAESVGGCSGEGVPRRRCARDVHGGGELANLGRHSSLGLSLPPSSNEVDDGPWFGPLGVVR